MMYVIRATTSEGMTWERVARAVAKENAIKYVLKFMGTVIHQPPKSQEV
jgi:hypothetical protein